jgi:hypothetical protein
VTLDLSQKSENKGSLTSQSLPARPSWKGKFESEGDLKHKGYVNNTAHRNSVSASQETNGTHIYCDQCVNAVGKYGSLLRLA